jgi:geranylgeranyl diphosphate synthase type II
MIFEARLKADQELVDAALKTYFTQSCSQARLLEAMRYSLLSGGKRLRPVLALAFCRACGGDEMAALPFACALEMVHTYSLIHDDLPCMDDDDFRRGRPTSHKVFGEAMAVLAGDALLTAAFETMLSKKNVSLAPARAAEAAACLAQAAGAYGMVGGQALDIGEEKELSAEELRKMYALKTGALIRAAAEFGCIDAGADHKLRDAALVYAEKVGVAFLIRDDLWISAGTPS